MERLTVETEKRNWRLYRIGWYVNFFLAVAAIVAAGFAAEKMFRIDIEAEPVFYLIQLVLVIGLALAALILLLGAGLSRYQARLEGQHLEIKTTILNAIALQAEQPEPKGDE